MSALLFLIIISAVSIKLSAQEFTGQIFDEKQEPLEAATVIGMAQDSAFISFTSSDLDGRFKLNGRNIHFVQISFIGYETKWLINENKELGAVDLGEIIMQVLNKQLEAVNVEARRNYLQFRGDTINFSTEHLAMQPGDVVEDILDQLPGIEVQEDGSVKAFGEDVENVLVDGEPFFGKDTRMATKNLAAQAVDKVQVYDKASDYSDFTGVEDGRDEKSINLELKEDFKNGHFGKVDLGYGDQGRFAGRGNLNSFGKTHRTSFIGLANNRNEPGFTMQQYLEFMGGLESFMQEGGRIEIDLNDQVGLPIGNNSEPGIHTRATGGINYNGKWSEKLKSQFHYLFNYNDQDLRENLTQESLITNDILRVLDTSMTDRRSQFHNAYFKTTFKPSASQQLTFNLNASMGFENMNSRSSQLNEVNNSESITNVLRQDQQEGRSTVLVSALHHKLKLKNNASLITNLDGTYHTKSQTTDQDLLTTWFDQNNSSQFIRQDYEMENSVGKFRTNYVWPISKNWTSDLSFSANAQKRSLARPWLVDTTGIGQLQMVDELSADVTNKILGFSPGLKLRYVRDSWNLSASIRYNFQEQSAEFGNEIISESKNYRSWLPSVFGRWEIGQSQSLNFDYFSDLILPTIEQLQPTPNYIDPLNLYVGNPELEAMLRHDVSIGYFHYSQWYDATTYARLSGGYVDNQINHLVRTDSLLRQTFTPVNTSSMRNARITAEHSRPLGIWNTSFKLKGSASYENGSLFVGDVENEIDKYSWRLSLGIGHRRVNKWKWGISHQIRKNQTQFSINTSFNQEFGTHTSKAFVQYLPTETFNIKIDAKRELFENALNIPQNDQIIIDLSMTRFFGSNRQMRLSLNIYDLLDQNTGINRWAEGNAVIDQRYNSLGRHFMLTFGYNIRGHKKENDGVINIRVGEE